MNAFALLAALGDTTSSFQDLVENKSAFSLDLLDQDEFLNEIIAHQPRLLSLHAPPRHFLFLFIFIFIKYCDLSLLIVFEITI
jgi:hypothetical protein